MCDHVYDSKSKQMLTTLELEKDYAKNILGAVDSALVALNRFWVKIVFFLIKLFSKFGEIFLENFSLAQI